MAIEKIEVLVATCDACGNPQGMNDDYMPMHENVIDLKNSIREQEWLIVNGQEGVSDKIYCPDCWSQDEKDNITIKPNVAGSDNG